MAATTQVRLLVWTYGKDSLPELQSCPAKLPVGGEAEVGAGKVSYLGKCLLGLDVHGGQTGHCRSHCYNRCR